MLDAPRQDHGFEGINEYGDYQPGRNNRSDPSHDQLPFRRPNVAGRLRVPSCRPPAAEALVERQTAQAGTDTAAARRGRMDSLGRILWAALVAPRKSPSGH